MILGEGDGSCSVPSGDPDDVEAVKVLALPMWNLVGAPMKFAEQLSHEILQLVVFPRDKDDGVLVLLRGQFSLEPIDIRIGEIRVDRHPEFDGGRLDRGQGPEIVVPDSATYPV
jgi:hypothetical protein